MALAEFRAIQGRFMILYTYCQTTGIMHDFAGSIIGIGYSGYGEGKNDHSKQYERNVGPIPCGLWTIDGFYQSKRLGADCISLSPYRHDAYGRVFFRIHGDSRENPGDASKGCIVLGPQTRAMIIGKCQGNWHRAFLMVNE